MIGLCLLSHLTYNTKKYDKGDHKFLFLEGKK
jgi:hypothetical protein